MQSSSVLIKNALEPLLNINLKFVINNQQNEHFLQKANIQNNLHQKGGLQLNFPKQQRYRRVQPCLIQFLLQQNLLFTTISTPATKAKRRILILKSLLTSESSSLIFEICAEFCKRLRRLIKKIPINPLN